MSRRGKAARQANTRMGSPMLAIFLFSIFRRYCRGQGLISTRAKKMRGEGGESQLRGERGKGGGIPRMHGLGCEREPS